MAECIKCGRYVDWKPPPITKKGKTSSPIIGVQCSYCTLGVKVIIGKNFVSPNHFNNIPSKFQKKKKRKRRKIILKNEKI
jgi:hypothetical protein